MDAVKAPSVFPELILLRAPGIACRYSHLESLIPSNTVHRPQITLTKDQNMKIQEYNFNEVPPTSLPPKAPPAEQFLLASCPRREHSKIIF